MNRIDYDTPQGIQEHLGSLDDLHEMLDARNADEEGDTLERWVLMGRYALAKFGNVGKYLADDLFDRIPAEVYPLIPDVVPEERLYDIVIRALNTPRENIGFSISMDSDIPKSHDRCVECHDGWRVRNAHDAEQIIDQEIMELSGYDGKTVNDVNEVLRARKSRDGDRWLNPDLWIVRTPGLTDQRGKDWRTAGQDYVIHEGDQAEVNRLRFLHQDCYRAKFDRESREEFEAMIEEAGFEGYDMVPTANQYGFGKYRGPWYRVNTKAGKPLIIGRRKRVFDIQWSPEDFQGDITDGDEVTRSDRNAHAWTREDAVRYLENLRIALAVSARASK